MKQVELFKLKQWKNPREYRSIVAYHPTGIYQVDIMAVYPLWTKIFSDQERVKYEVNDYAVVCVDVYSRYVKARSIYKLE
jgi:hypothetical protein